MRLSDWEQRELDQIDLDTAKGQREYKRFFDSDQMEKRAADKADAAYQKLKDERKYG